MPILSKFSHKNHHNILFLGILVLIGITIFSHRFFFLNQIDTTYLEDLYSHSQWNMPLSTRIMADGDLYQVAGKKLLQGASSFTINPEVPPVGKYLYGLGVIFWNNPYLISLEFYLLGTFLFFILSWLILKNKEQSLFATTLLLLSPIFSNQIYQTMLDLPQLVFLLGHLISIIVLKRVKSFPKKIFLITSGGITLGLFAATKIPLLLIPLLIADFIYLCTKKEILTLGLMSAIGGLVYFISYLPTIINANLTLVEWTKAQWWMINFYLSSGVTQSFLYYLSAIFIGFHRVWWGEKNWQQIVEWTFLWPISIFSLGLSFIKKSKPNQDLSYLHFLSLGFLLIWLLTPFWGRYFLLVIPFLIITLVSLFKNNKVLIILITIFSFLSFFPSLVAKPNHAMRIIQEKFSVGNYQDFYDFIITDLNRDEFYLALKEVQLDTQAQKQEFVFKDKNTVEVKYSTPAGIYANTCQVNWALKQNHWYLHWNWDCIYPNFDQQNDQFLIELDTLNQNLLEKIDPKSLKKWEDQKFLMVKMNQVNDYENLLKQLAEVFRIKEAEVEKKMFIDYKNINPIPFGFIPSDADPAILNKLSSNPALMLKHAPNRIHYPLLQEFCSSIPDSSEINEPNIYENIGGRLILKNKNQSKKIILEQDSLCLALRYN